MPVIEFETEQKDYFNNEEVQKYLSVINKKKASLAVKRIFDVVVSAIMLILLSPVILVISIAIKLDTPGNVIFKQERVTRYNRTFYIYKFRTMVSNAEKLGTQVTVDNDVRITRVGGFLRKYRLDELPQLLNILKGDMSFVGPRPEVRKFVDEYTPEMYAALLLPAGVTSLACIYFKDEDKLLSQATNAEETYLTEILPVKMKYNLEYIKCFNFWYDIKLMFLTVFAVLKKDSNPQKYNNINIGNKSSTTR